ncbi:2-hydroxyacid dehydrogenase [Cellulomonas soli]|uniref:2-hydroxyacid dehydrogenase n=1 Tax=Cellulomonas soli TaxID=931535 RepID=UPI0015C97F38|nr:NAD(P)-dependent oxidoreductase [Cellulomonas soli]NYI57395.1 D-3-phosphoglycerate dehydrogenase [Cellulomonas soli]
MSARPRIVCPSGEGGLAALFDASPLRERLEAVGDLTVHLDVPDDAQVRARLADADAGLLSTHLTSDTLRAIGGRTRLLAFTGTGAASYVDLPTAREHGIAVSNVTGYGDRAVAEHALALLLGAARSVAVGDRTVRAGDWSGMLGPELGGMRIGVVGFGGIGRTFAQIAAALGMHVHAWDRSPHPDLTALAGPDARWLELDELLATCDAVSLHLPLTPQTRGLLTLERLDLLRPGTILVNTARGELIAPGALATRLARGDLLAAIDVFDPEPLPADDPLLQAPGTTFTPHLGFRTPQALRRMAEGTVECVERFFAGDPVRIVN